MVQRANQEDRSGVLHFVTLKVRERRWALRDEWYVRPVLEALRLHCDEHPAKLIAYVAMPEHLHAILNLRDGLLTHFLTQFKPAVSLAIAAAARTLHDESLLEWLYVTPDHRPQFWQDGKHSMHLYTDRMIWQKINYIHNNPLRWKLARRAPEYAYSSFADFYQIDGVKIIPVDHEFWWEED